MVLLLVNPYVVYNIRMKLTEVTAQRLYRQHLLQPVDDLVRVVREFGAVQAQDYVGAKWALGMRAQGATDESITKLYNDGKILRTHILRPTWHFVAAEDIRWIQQLTASRVHAFNKYYYKKLELDEATLQKSTALLVKTLQGGKQLTRDELRTVFTDAGFGSMNLRLGYIIIYAELEAVVCSGAMKGKQHTYALVDERVPRVKPIDPDAALVELTKRFFTTHGPAQIADFAWWSSLTTADIKRGIALANLKTVKVDDKTYYYAEEMSATIPSPIAHLLPNYDEYFIAYKDRSAFSSRFKMSRMPPYEAMSYHLLAIDGQMAGGWKRMVGRGSLTVQLNPFIRLTAAQTKAVELARQKLETFVGIPVGIEPQ